MKEKKFLQINEEIKIVEKKFKKVSYEYEKSLSEYEKLKDKYDKDELGPRDDYYPTLYKYREKRIEYVKIKNEYINILSEKQDEILKEIQIILNEKKRVKNV